MLHFYYSILFLMHWGLKTDMCVLNFTQMQIFRSADGVRFCGGWRGTSSCSSSTVNSASSSRMENGARGMGPHWLNSCSSNRTTQVPGAGPDISHLLRVRKGKEEQGFIDLEMLPPELSITILSYLNATELCLASCVWQDLGSDEYLWQGLVMFLASI